MLLKNKSVVEKHKKVLLFFLLTASWVGLLILSTTTNHGIIPICNTNDKEDIQNISTVLDYDLSYVAMHALFDKEMNEFSRISKITNWTHFQNPKMARDIRTPNPNEILRRYQMGEGSFCGGMAVLNTAALQVNGLKSRTVELEIVSDPYNDKFTHVVSEAWSNDYDKWVLMDPTYNGYWIKDNIPLSVIEIQEILDNGEAGLKFIKLDNKTKLSVNDNYDNALGVFNHAFYMKKIMPAPKITNTKLDSFLKQYSKECWVHYTGINSKPVWYSNVHRVLVLWILPILVFVVFVDLAKSIRKSIKN